MVDMVKRIQKVLIVALCMTLIAGFSPVEPSVEGVTDTARELKTVAVKEKFKTKKVSRKTIEEHYMQKDLDTEEQKEAYSAYVRTLKNYAKNNNLTGEEVSFYEGYLSKEDVAEVQGVISDEFFGMYGSAEIWYYDYDDGTMELVMIPKRDVAMYKKNITYTKKIQSIAKKIVKKGWSEKKASDTIQKWIKKRLKQTTNTKYGDGWLAYKNRRGTCEGYSQLYRAMCNGVGIKCRIVVGYGDGEGHEWTRVKVNGAWKYSDVCWYDGGFKKCAYSTKLWKDHRIDKDFYRN